MMRARTPWRPSRERKRRDEERERKQNGKENCKLYTFGYIILSRMTQVYLSIVLVHLVIN